MRIETWSWKMPHVNSSIKLRISGVYLWKDQFVLLQNMSCLVVIRAIALLQPLMFPLWENMFPLMGKYFSKGHCCRGPIKKLFLIISQNSHQKHLRRRLLVKRDFDSCFLVNFVIFLISFLLLNISGRPILSFRKRTVICRNY